MKLKPLLLTCLDFLGGVIWLLVALGFYTLLIYGAGAFFCWGHWTIAAWPVEGRIFGAFLWCVGAGAWLALFVPIWEELYEQYTER